MRYYRPKVWIGGGGRDDPLRSSAAHIARGLTSYIYKYDEKNKMPKIILTASLFACASRACMQASSTAMFSGLVACAADHRRRGGRDARMNRV